MQIVHKNETNIPEILKEIPHPPKNLYIRGNLPLDSTCVAVVGTRKATSSGLKFARSLAEDLARAGVVIVSGLAMGIDTAAHQGALSEKTPTIAVLANGLDITYPRQNHNLAEDILRSGGALVSEYSEGTPPFPNQFIARNRIISGLSQVVIVIEAPERSGALATARFALEQNRDVFVVPGPPTHPNYVGAHKLIQQGGALVTSARDVLEFLEIMPGNNLDIKNYSETINTSGLSPEEKEIFLIIKSAGSPIGADYILEHSPLSLPEINTHTSCMIMKGTIKESAGKFHL